MTVSRRVFNLALTSLTVAPRLAWPASGRVPKSLDHIILGCNDLAAGVEYVYQRIGVRAAAPLVGWAIHRHELKNFASVLQRAGVECVGPKPGSRVRPDGNVLNWASLTLKDDENGRLPFFIEWGVGSAHPSVDAPAGCRVSGLWIDAPDPANLRELSAKLQLDAQIRKYNELRLAATIEGPKGSLQLFSR